ncbi:MAG: peptidoglycan editing factor PgeF [Desulfobulbus sp.]|nr:peptidoglycan editing factor PgeF [Desulfobulbus sp.]
MRYILQPIPHYTSALLTAPHALFTREGGVSKGLFASLNLSYHVGDEVEYVSANRELVRTALAFDRLYAAHQVHGDQILVIEENHPVNQETEGYDALITTVPGTGLLIQQADCQAVLLSCPEQRVVAAVHCGWRGSVLNIINKTVQCLTEQFAVRPETIRAVISPSLGPCCAEFTNYHRELPAWMHAYQVRPHYFNFWAISCRQLEESGILPQHIEVAGLCTRCSRHFFSYRRASAQQNGLTGRNGSVIGLSSPE